MAKLEIPSIVVHSGSPSVPEVSMDRTARQTPQLRKQKSSLDDGESLASGCIHHCKSEASGPAANNNNTNSSNNNNPQTSSKSPETTSGGGGGGGGGGGSSSKPGSPGGPNSKNDEVEKPANGPQPQLSRSRSNGKMKMLTRSHAMREATSPPPDPSAAVQVAASAPSATATSPVTSSTNAQSTPATVVSNSNGKNNGQASKFSNNNNHNGSNNHHTSSSSNNVNGSGNSNNNNNNKTKNGNHKNNREQNKISSNRANNHWQQNKNVIYISSPQDTWSGLLCRDNSTDSQYQDAAKADLHGFIAQQMSTKNRPLLLRVEEELVQLVQDQRPVYFRFPQMSSFHRMLVHRAATYFQMDHNLDASGTSVVVNRNKGSRMPERSFLQIMRDIKGLNSRAYSCEEPRKSILKRDYASFEDSQYKSDEKQLSLESRRSKSFEEREEEYERARRRIFSRDDSTDSCHRSDSNQDSMEDVRWSECATWSGDEPEPTGRYLRPNDRSARLMKTESYESRESLKGNSMRSAVSKSNSFGGYTGNGGSMGNNGRLGPSHGQSYAQLQRGDSNASSLSTGSRMLAKQDSASSVSSRLSPSSSGYKSQSQQSDATLSATPSPTATPLSLLPMSSQGSQDTLSPEPPVIWPMTSMGNIPPGSVLINPATGQPICNADGSIYQYDPENPLTLHIPRSESPAKQSPTNHSSRQNEKENAKDEATEDGSSWANQTSHSSSLKASQATATAGAAKAEASKPAAPQPSQQKAPAQYDKPAAEKAPSSNATDQQKNHHKEPGHAHTHAQDKRSYHQQQPRDSDYRKGDAHAAAKSAAENPPASLNVPEATGSGRSMTNSATSPMLVAAPSPQRPQPTQTAGHVSGHAAGQSAGHGAAQPASHATPPSYSVPMLPYAVQPHAQPQHYHNGYGYATAPVGAPGMAPGMAPGPAHAADAYYSSVANAGVPYHPYAVDPATGSYVAPPPQQATQQPPPGPPQQGAGPAPCCMPGFPCMYAAAGPAPPPGGPPGGYDQRGSDVTGQAVSDMTGYMMGLTLNGSAPGAAVAAMMDQRAGGDAGQLGQLGQRNDGSSPHQGPGGPQAPHVMVAGTGSYYWGPQISSHNQGYPPSVVYYYPPNNVPSPQNTVGVGVGSGSTSVAANNSNSNYNRGTSPSTNTRDNGNSKNNSNASGSSASGSAGGHRSSYNRNVAASYAKGAAIYQPPVYSMPNMAGAPQAQDRTGINGYPNDCVGVANPQQQVVYTVSSMHTSTVPTQSYQPSVYSSAALTATGSAQPSTLAYYQGIQGGGDASAQAQGQQLVPMNPYAGPQGYIPAPGTPPLTPQGSYGVHPYVYGMYSQPASAPGGPTSPAAYPNIAPHQSPMIQRMMRPNMIAGVVQSSPPPRSAGPKGFPRGHSPVARKDHGGSGDNIRFSPPYTVPMYNLAASRYMSGDMRYMAGRLPFSIPTNSYQRAIRPFQTSYYRPNSQPSGEALSLTRPPRVRKPTSTQARSPARGPFVGREFKASSRPPAVMKTS